MQLKNLSLSAILALGTYAYGQEELTFNLLYYHENGDRVSAIAPFLAYDEDIGTDFKWHIDGTFDVVSGATPTWSGDGASGASANVTTVTQNITYTTETFSDKRGALNTNILIRDEERNEYVLGGSISIESDFQNIELYSSKSGYFDEFHNTSYSFGGSFANNYVGYKSDDDNDDDDDDNDDTSSGASASTSIGGAQNIFGLNTSLTQIIDDHSLFSLGVFGSYESGFLSNLHLRIARDYVDNTTHLDYESRPSSRAILGGSLKYAISVGEILSLSSSYRYYIDTWEMSSHTVMVGATLELGGLTIAPQLRYYTQNGAYFYSAGHFKNSSVDVYASSDERLSPFNSITYLLNGYFQINEKYRYNIGINYFSQTTGLSGYFFTTGVNIAL